MQKSVPRDSNIELMRIVCIFLLVCHHYIVHGLYLSLSDQKYALFAQGITAVGKICIIAFLAVSSWYLSDKPFRSVRFAKTWMEVLFYSVTLAVLTSLLGRPFTPEEWFGVFLPIAGSSHGFASAYLAFYLLIPFLQKSVQQAGKKQLLGLVIALTYFQIIIKGIGYTIHYQQQLFSELQLFILVYFILVYLKRFPIHFLENKWIDLLITVTCWGIATVGPRIASDPGLFNSINADESGIFNIIGGIALMFFFKNIRIKPNRVINAVASTTFGILLIHDHNFFRYPLWREVLRVQDRFNSRYFLIWMGLTCLFVFCVSMVIDFARIYLLERPLFRIPKLNDFFDRVDRVWK